MKILSSPYPNCSCMSVWIYMDIDLLKTTKTKVVYDCLITTQNSMIETAVDNTITRK